MMKCFLDCSGNGKSMHRRSHWHCALCSKFFQRKSKMQSHLNTHSKKPQQSRPRGSTKRDKSATPKLVCPECDGMFTSKHSLQRHIRENHNAKLVRSIQPGRFLRGVCVDFREGIFMISRTFSGTMHPIHCRHSTHGAYTAAGSSACEVEDCRDAAKVGRQSGHPAYECVHLQSVQYAAPFQQPGPLRPGSLNELIDGRKWLKESRRQSCRSYLSKAEQNGSPLVVQFPIGDTNLHSTRRLYFSVYEGAAHYWSRFGRVVVTFQKESRLWACACSSGKVGCAHKAIAKWFLYQEDPGLLVGDAPEDEDRPEDFIDVEESDSAPGTDRDHLEADYPPTGTTLKWMVRHHLEKKRIPADLEEDHTTEGEHFPLALIPEEEQCSICDCPLATEEQITSRAVILGVTKVITGRLQWMCVTKHSFFLYNCDASWRMRGWYLNR